MRWYYWPLFALIMGFALGGSFAAAIIAPVEKSSAVQTTETSENTQTGHNGNLCEGKPFWEKVSCDPVAYFTMWLAGFTLALAVLTGFLWGVTQLIFVHGRRTTERQLRAYVFVKEAVIDNIEGPGPIATRITLKNYGQTPAYKFRALGEAKCVPFPNADFSRDESRDKGLLTTTLAPSGEAKHFVEFTLDETDRIKAELKSGKSAIYMFGRLQYVDAFKKARSANFRYIYGGNAGTRIVEIEGKRFGAMAQTSEGNSSEDE